MTIRTIVLLLGLTAGLISCSADKPQESKRGVNEFEILCAEFTELVDSENYANLNEEQRAVRLDKMLANKLSVESNAYIAWTAIRNATPAARQALYSEAARSLGYDNWSCPAISSHADQVGSPHD